MYPFWPGLLFLLTGSLVVVLTIVGFVLTIRSFWHMHHVRKHGISLLATVTGIDKESALVARVGYTISFFVYADWQDPETGIVHHFKSDAGGKYLPINHPPGSSIEVLVDPGNFRHYEVQLLPEDRTYR